jgi:hypothetical protein
MTPFNKANQLIHDILISDYYIIDIALDDDFEQDFLYQSEYPLYIPPQLIPNEYRFLIQLFRYDSKNHCLDIVDLEYAYEPGADIVYVPRPELRESDNEFGKKLIKNESFLECVKPLLIKGFREVAFEKLTI